MSGQPKQVVRSPLAENSVRQRMWNAMRALRTFTVADLEATAEAADSHARGYVRALDRGGYLICVKKQVHGSHQKPAVYLFARDTGPLAPRQGKQGLMDPNIDPKAKTHGDRDRVIPENEYQHALRCVRACHGMSDPETEVAELRRKAGELDAS